LEALVTSGWGGRDTKLLGQVASLLANHLVVPGQHGTKLTHFIRLPALRGQLAGFDIRGIGVIENCDDGGII
jgi:hypothetical protein